MRFRTTVALVFALVGYRRRPGPQHKVVSWQTMSMSSLLYGTSRIEPAPRTEFSASRGRRGGRR
jgi:hypothetical protein